MLVLLLGALSAAWGQGDVPADIPPEWLVPIGGGGAAAETGDQPVTTPDATGGGQQTEQPTVPSVPVGQEAPATGAGQTDQQPATGAGQTDQQPATGAGQTDQQPATGAGQTDQPTQQPTVPAAPETGGEQQSAPPVAVGDEAPAGGAEQQPAAGETASPTQPSASAAQESVIPVESDENNGQTNEDAVNNTPPGPPMDWVALPLDKTIIFGIEIKGPALVPWTITKNWIFVQTLHEPYLASCDVDDIEAGVVDSFSTQNGGRRLQETTESGIRMRIRVHTNSIRVDSEIASVKRGIDSQSLKTDLAMMLGTEITSISMVTDPEIYPYNSVPDANESTGGSMPGWIIGAIVGGIIVLIPIPAYLLYKRSKRKHLEALAKHQAEAAAARQRMQSRIIKTGGAKSFTTSLDTTKMNDLEIQDIYAHSAQTLNTPGSIISARQNSGLWLPSLPSSSNFGTPRVDGYGGNSPRRSWQHQQLRTLYQQNSLGPGGMPSVSRISSYTSTQRHAPGTVYPVRYSDEDTPSSSSGNLSEPAKDRNLK